MINLNPYYSSPAMCGVFEELLVLIKSGIYMIL